LKHHRGNHFLRFGFVEAGRKPRTGLKLTIAANREYETNRRGREKTQNGIETIEDDGIEGLGRESRQGENPERD